jgi:hypothetical protein
MEPLLDERWDARSILLLPPRGKKKSKPLSFRRGVGVRWSGQDAEMVYNVSSRF